MLTAATLPQLQTLLAQRDLDGWLLFDFKGRNRIARAALGEWTIGTRRMSVSIPRSGVPIAVTHEIDAELGRDWPNVWNSLAPWHS